MRRHVALVVWAFPGDVSPYVHAATDHTEKLVCDAAYRFAHQAGLKFYRVHYLGEITGEHMDLVKRGDDDGDDYLRHEPGD